MIHFFSEYRYNKCIFFVRLDLIDILLASVIFCNFYSDASGTSHSDIESGFLFKVIEYAFDTSLKMYSNTQMIIGFGLDAHGQFMDV